MITEKPFDLVDNGFNYFGDMGGKEVIGKLLKINPEAKVVPSQWYSKIRINTSTKINHRGWSLYHFSML